MLVVSWWLSREKSSTSQKHHRRGSGAHRISGKATIMNYFLKKFNGFKKNDKQVTQKQGSEYFYVTGIPSPIIG